MLKYSYSTHKLYRVCPRKLYFSKIAAAWNSNNKFRKKAYELKKLSNISLLTGNIIHFAIKKYIYNLFDNNSNKCSDLINISISKFLDILKYSKENSFILEENNLDGFSYCRLFEHEYGLPITSKDIEKALNIIDNSLNNLFNINIKTENGDTLLLNLVRKSFKRYVEDDIFSFDSEGVKIYIKPDLVLLFGKASLKQVVIIDWKIEKNEDSDNRNQMQLYGYGCYNYLKYNYNINFDNIFLLEVNLLQNRIIKKKFNELLYNDTDDYLFENIREYKLIMGNGDFDELDINDFKTTFNFNSCNICNFKKICLENNNKEEKENANIIFELF